VITVEINNDLLQVPLDEKRVQEAVRIILQDASLKQGEISVAVVDDPTICRLHQKYLGVDEPTDVMSFVLDRSKDRLEGEVIVSADTADLTAGWYGWTAADELLLYVIHGTLHLVGYDDATPEKKAEMRERELTYLAHFGVKQRCEASETHPEDSA